MLHSGNLEKINKVYSSLGRTDIMMIAFAHLASAVCAFEFFVIKIDVTCTYLQFEIQMFREYECETIGEASAIGIALITIIGKNREVGS
jgi:hypothetical protein